MNASTEAAIYERQAERARSELTQSIHELRGKLTTSQILDELMSYMRSGGSNVVAGLATAMRENPVPTMLIATGCALFLRGPGGGRAPARNGDGAYHRHGRDDAASSSGFGAGLASAAGGAADSVRGAAGATGAALRDGAASAADGVRDAADSVRDTAASAADSVREGARSAGESVRGYAAAAGERASETWHDAERGTRELYDSAMRLAQEQPLMVAAIGVALGAAIGAALPATRVENELLGEAADSVKREANKAFGDVTGALRREASGAVEDVRQAVAEDGGHGQQQGGSSDGSAGHPSQPGAFSSERQRG